MVYRIDLNDVDMPIFTEQIESIYEALEDISLDIRDREAGRKMIVTMLALKGIISNLKQVEDTLNKEGYYNAR